MRIDDIPADSYVAKVLWQEAAQDPWVLAPEDGTHINVSHNGWVELEFGVIDAAVKSWFYHGNCVALAQAMHARTNLPIAIVRCHPHPPFDNAFTHALLRLPNGELLDINGCHQESEVLAQWQQESQQEVWLEEMSLLDVTEIAGHINEMPAVERMVSKHFADLALIAHDLLPGPWWELPDYEVKIPAEISPQH